MLRINGLDTPFAYRDLIDVVEAAGDRIDLVMLPKAGPPRDVAFVDTLLTQIEASRLPRRIGIEAQIETAAGFLYAREIAQCLAAAGGADLRPRRLLGIDADAVVVASANSTSTTTLYPGPSLARRDAHHCGGGARQRPARHGRPFRGVQGRRRLRTLLPHRARHGLRRQAVHPSGAARRGQLASSCPTADEVAHAERVVQAYEQAAAEGRGAASLDGR